MKLRSNKKMFRSKQRVGLGVAALAAPVLAVVFLVSRGTTRNVPVELRSPYDPVLVHESSLRAQVRALATVAPAASDAGVQGALEVPRLRRVVDVDTDAVEDYLEAHPPDSEAEFEARRALAVLVAERRLDVETEVRCNGGVCRYEFTFESADAMERIFGARPEGVSEFAYRLERGEAGEFILVVYVTTQQATFSDLLT